MLIAVTGGTGFIGRALVHFHVKCGDQVRILSRYHQKFPVLDAVTLYQGDLISSVDLLSQFVDGVDILYHCAGEIRDQGKMYPVHVTGTKNLCAAAFGKIGHWVQLSSVGAYGPHASGVLTEKTPLNPIGIYETTKTESDRIVINAAREEAFTYSILRPSNVFGPSMTNQSLFQMIEIINKGFFFFIGKPGASANYIHVDNVVEGLVQCGKKDAARGRIYNLSDHRTIEDFVAVVTDELRKPAPKLRLPEMPVRWVARMCERLPHFPLTEPRVNALTNRSIYSIERIQHELEYTYQVSMEDGLLQMVKVWKQAA